MRKVWFEAAVGERQLLPYDPVLEPRRLQEVKQQEKAIAAAAATRARAERIAAIKAKRWPPDIEKTVIDRKIQLGMTEEQIIMAWDKPQRIYRTVGPWGTHEQWVYNNAYLYIENRVLMSFQDSR